MEEAMPTKPPRGVKPAKETSHLLMSVIHALSASKSEEQREKEKLKLERDYEKSNKKIDELVNRHYNQLVQVMQAFARVSTQITTSREKMKIVRESLEECKVLLRCRREELRKLWLEGVEHKHALQLLHYIGELREAPIQIKQHLERKQYVAATTILMSSVKLSEEELAGVDALKEVRSELLSKRHALQTKLMEELRFYLYIASTSELTSFGRLGSGKEGTSSNFQRGLANLRGSKGNRTKKRLWEPLGRIGDLNAGTEVDCVVDDELDGLDVQERQELWFNTVIECLCLLKKMPEAVDFLKTKMQSELGGMIPRATRHVLERSQTVPCEESSAAGGQLLQDLVQSVLDQMRKIADAHALLLRCASKTCTRLNTAVRLYDIHDVWINIQSVLQSWLSEYLEVASDVGSNTDTPDGSAPFSQPSLDISSFFMRRKPARHKKTHLFHFHNSYRANKAKEQNDSEKKTLVCPADLDNIKVIYGPLSAFIEELEQTSPSPCALHVFVHNYVRDIFLKTHHSKLMARLSHVTKEKDAWRAVTDAEETTKLSLPVPVLRSALIVESMIAELRSLMRAIPDFTDPLIIILTNILSNYREVCQAAYRGIVQPDSEDKRIFSSAWLKDDDINRFLKSLPNWAELQAHKPTHRTRRLQREETNEEESPEDVRQRNMKEAEILASNIGEGIIQRSELLSDVGQLKKLAQLHESMEWLAAQILLVVADLKSLRDDKVRLKVSEAAEQSLFQLVHDFTELADTCLLLLHLEVRVQCFHYLPSKVQATGVRVNTLEPDAHVKDLSKVLMLLYDSMTTCLQARKIKYMFEGVGHLIAKIFISSTQYLARIDENTVGKMARNVLTLQQTLSQMTATRDLALDHATTYFQLLQLTPDKLLAGLVERGPIFSDMEYMHALQLLHRSQPNEYGPISQHLERLSNILGETGVTV